MKKKLITLALGGVMLTGCSGSSQSPVSSGSTGQAAQNQLVKPLTIDDSGVVPAFSDAAVSTQTYIHNNSTSDIVANIVTTYNLALSPAKGKTNPANYVRSAQIKVPAGGSARLPINIPALSGKGQKGSAVITASYTYQGKQYSFNQLIDFHLYTTTQQGVFLASGGLSSAFGNHIGGYTTVYLYGSGNAGSSYTIKNIQTDPALGAVVQGNIVGSKLVSHQVEAIELHTEVLPHNKSGAISVTASNGSGSYIAPNKTVNVIGEDASGNGQGILIPSLVPNLDISQSQSGKAYVYNAGNTSITLGTASANNGMTATINTASCGTGGTLDSGQTCEVDFNLPTTILPGSSVIKFSGSLTQIPVTWYNSNSQTAQLGIDTDADAGLTLAGDGSGTVNVTVSNIGGVAVKMATETASSLSGSAAVTVPTNGTNTCGTNSLSTTAICNYTVNVTDTTNPDAGMINVSAGGTYGSAESQVSNHVPVQYTSNGQQSATISVSSTPSSLSIVGNGTDISTSKVKIVNNGDTPTGPLSVSFNSGSANGATVIGTTTCNTQSLNKDESCTETVTLGTQTLTGPTITGNASYTVSASGVPESSVTIGLTVQSQNNALVLNSVTESGNLSGAGKTADDSVIFQAGNANSKKIVFKYAYQGTDHITISGIQFGNQNANWAVEYSDVDTSSCFSSGAGMPVNKILNATNPTCTVTLDNDLYQSGDANSTTNLDVPFPGLVVSSSGSDPFQFTPALNGYTDNVLYAANKQAIIIDTNSNAIESLVVTHAISGYTDGGYNSPIVLTSQITPGADISLPQNVTDSCSRNFVNGALKEVCSFTGDDQTFSSSYPINYGIGGVTQTENMVFNYSDNLLNTQAFVYLNSDGSTNAQQGNNEASDIIEVDPLPPSLEAFNAVINGTVN